MAKRYAIFYKWSLFFDVNINGDQLPSLIKRLIGIYHVLFFYWAVLSFFMRICVSYRISWIRIIDLIIILFSISIYLYVFTLSTSILELLRAPEFYYFPNFLEPPENVNTKIKTKNNPNWTLSKFYWVRLCPNLPQNEINFPKKHKKMKFSEKKNTK